MVIRQIQLTKFAALAQQRFEEQAVHHMKCSFPDLYNLLGEKRSLRLLRHAQSRAARWKITGTPEICRFLNIMVVLSPHFDDDPRLPWARRILGARNVPESERMNRLTNAVSQVLDQVASS